MFGILFIQNIESLGSRQTALNQSGKTNDTK